MDLFARIAELLGISVEDVNALSAEQIDRRLIEAGESIDLSNASDEDLERLERLGAVAQEVRELAAYDEAVRTERRDRAAEAAARLRGEPETPATTDETTDETEPGEGPGAGEPGEREPSPPETGAPASAPDNTEPASTDAPASPTTEETRVPVAASAPRRLPPVARRAPVARQAPEAHSPIPMRQGAVTAITAAADVPGRSAGSEFGGWTEVAEAMVDRWGTLENARGVDGNVPVATIAANYPSNRVIDTMDASDTERIFDRELAQLQAITAAGGFCAPVTPVYDLATVSVADRPVRDALPSFMATRGGITWVAPPKLSDIVAESPNSVSTWSATTDTTPGGSTKPCAVYTCGAATTQLLDAIPVCRQFGNFQARAYPEQVERLMQLTVAWQARYAERKLLTAIGAGSTNISTGQTLGAARDFFAEAQRIDARYRQNNRMSVDARLRFIAPFHLRQRLRADLIRQLPGDNSMAQADEIIDAAMQDLNWNVTWALDGETGQEFGAQVAGGANPWPTTVVWYLFHEGAWIFLDGGTLDIGLVRDSTLNAKNNFQIFSETFEQYVMRGVESLRVSSTLCQAGTGPATVTATGLCTSGS